MVRDHDPDFEQWIQRARDAEIVPVAESVLNVKLRRAGRDWHAACPKCGGKDNNEFVLTPGNEQGKQFLCRKSSEGGSVITMVMHCLGVKFVEACEVILNEPPPRRSAGLDPRPVDHDRERITRDAEKDRQIAARESDRASREKKANRSMVVFESAYDIAGTLGDRYFRARGLALMPEQRKYLRFIPDHPYYDGADGGGAPIIVGRWPAVVALMRRPDGTACGIHCTYLDRDEPRKLRHEVVDADGRPSILNPRKMYGTKGLIWLSDPRPMIAVGEGIETSLSWFEINTHIDDIAVAAAGDIGNMAGRSTGRVRHPRFARLTIPNGIPDPDEPGAAMPACVKEVVLLGDSDIDEANVRAHLLTAGRRHVASGLSVSVHMAVKPEGQNKWDWNDELMLRKKRGEI